MRLGVPLVLAALVAAPAAAEVSVRVLPAAPGAVAQVELTARAAPLAEVLDRLSRQIGMKVVYEGASPRQLVTVSLQGRTPAETVLGLLEGTGVNFALQADASGERVETLLVAGSAPQSSASSASASASPTGGRSIGPSSFRRPVTPPGSGPDVIDEDDPEDLEEDLEEPAPEEGAPAPDPNAGNPQGGAMPPPPGNPPTSSFPVSPFAPQATPYTPQPFPPVPPGAPVPAPTQPQQEPAQQPPPN